MPGQPQLIRVLVERIARSPYGRIPFASFMEEALYHPLWGYYSRFLPVGKAGDYYTSVSLNPVFGEVLAQGFAALLRALWPQGPYRMVEFGAGDGRLAGHLLDAMAEKAPDLYAHLTYAVVEVRPERLDWERLSPHRERLVYLPDLSSQCDLEGILFSNEFVDALPVHWVKKQGGQLGEVWVSWNEGEEKFEPVFVPGVGEEIVRYLEEEGVELEEGEEVEVNLKAREWLRECGRRVKKGLLVTIDYGFFREEYGEPHLRRGTLRGYSRHQVTPEVLEGVGERDITADVNFSALMRWGEEAGWTNVWWGSQKEFLLAWGIFQLLAPASEPFSPQGRRNRAIRQLVLPEGGMGHRFHVLVQHKGVPGADVEGLKPLFSPPQIPIP